MKDGSKVHGSVIHGSKEHMSSEQWIQYIQDRLPILIRKKYEAHLYVCDLCLSVYMNCVDQLADTLPFVSDAVDFSAKVSEFANRAAGKRNRSASFLRNSLFHYSIAACITLLLLTTGVFQSLITQFNHLSSETSSSSQGTVSSAIVDKAASLIGEWPTKSERGNNK